MAQTVVALVRTDATEAALRACGRMNGTRLDLRRIGRLGEVESAVRAAGGAPDALLLEIDAHNGGEIDALGTLMATRFPGLPVIATAADASLKDVRRLMHLGVADLLPQPFSQDDLASALNRIAGAAKNTGGGGNRGTVICFLKGGGGVGATTLAVHTAWALRSAGARGRTAETCVLDLDLQHGDAALQLDLPVRVGLADLIESPERLDRALLSAAMSRHDSGVSVLAAPLDMMPLAALSPELVGNCIDLARRDYDHVVVDLPHAWTEWSDAALRCSDVIVVVTQLTVPGVRNARRQIDTLQIQAMAETPVVVVLNRADHGFFKSRQLKDAEKGLGRAVDHFIPSDYPLVSEALNHGVLLPEIKRGTRVEKAIRKLAAGLHLTLGARVPAQVRPSRAA